MEMYASTLLVHLSFFLQHVECPRRSLTYFVVNLGMKKVYVQSAFRIPNEEKMRQETASLRKSGDFFKKIVVTSGSRRALTDDCGIVHVGVIPFLLEPSILTD